MIHFREQVLKPSRWSSPTLTATGFVYLVFIGAFDYMTGRDVSFSIFYLIPILPVAWFGGILAGGLISVLGTAIWLWADVKSGTGYTHFLVPYWNAVVRLGLFAIVTYFSLTLKGVLEREKWAVAREQRRMLIALLEQTHDSLTGILANLSLLEREDLPLTAKISLGEIRQCAAKIQSVLLGLRNLDGSKLGAYRH